MKPSAILYGMALLLIGMAIGFNAAPAIAAFTPLPTTIDLTHHDAAGRTQHVVATLNTATYATKNGSPYAVYVDYTSQQLFCSGFGP